jgi:acetyltransferase-like isoleucine patch superfamily enzyme
MAPRRTLDPRQYLRAARGRVAAARLVRRTAAALVPPPPWAFDRFGNRSVIVPPARIEGANRISIGDGVLIHEHAWLMARGGPLVIGDRSVLNRFVKVVVFGGITMGEGVIIGDHAYLSDVEYEPGHADVPPEHRPLTQPQPVVLGPYAALGVGVIVKPGVTIGERAYVGAGSIVTRDVPPHTLAVGAPARVVREFDAR